MHINAVQGFYRRDAAFQTTWPAGMFHFDTAGGALVTRAWLVNLPVKSYFFIHWQKSTAWTVNGQKLLLLGWKQTPGQSQMLVLKPCTPERIFVLNVTTAVSW